MTKISTKICGKCVSFGNAGTCRKDATAVGYFDEKACFKPREGGESPEPETVTATKVCKRCGQVLPLSHFGHHFRSADGYKSICKSCQSASIKKMGGVHMLKNSSRSLPRLKAAWIRNPRFKESTFIPMTSCSMSCAAGDTTALSRRQSRCHQRKFIHAKSNIDMNKTLTIMLKVAVAAGLTIALALEGLSFVGFCCAAAITVAAAKALERLEPTNNKA